jgi:hypothetical protein
MKRCAFGISIICLAIFLGLLGCDSTPGSCPDLESMPLQVSGGYVWVTITPAGESRARSYDPADCQFPVVEARGDFLPAPFNRGVFPKAQSSGLLLTDARVPGTVDTVRLIGALALEQEGKQRLEVLAVPVDSFLSLSTIRNYQDLAIRYPVVKRMVEDWFRNYEGPGTTEILGWKDETFAARHLKDQAGKE